MLLCLSFSLCVSVSLCPPLCLTSVWFSVCVCPALKQLHSAVEAASTNDVVSALFSH